MPSSNDENIPSSFAVFTSTTRARLRSGIGIRPDESRGSKKNAKRCRRGLLAIPQAQNVGDARPQWDGEMPAVGGVIGTISGFIENPFAQSFSRGGIPEDDLALQPDGDHGGTVRGEGDPVDMSAGLCVELRHFPRLFTQKVHQTQ